MLRSGYRRGDTDTENVKTDHRDRSATQFEEETKELIIARWFGVERNKAGMLTKRVALK